MSEKAAGLKGSFICSQKPFRLPDKEQYTKQWFPLSLPLSFPYFRVEKRKGSIEKPPSQDPGPEGALENILHKGHHVYPVYTHLSVYVFVQHECVLCGAAKIMG